MTYPAGQISLSWPCGTQLGTLTFRGEGFRQVALPKWLLLGIITGMQLQINLAWTGEVLCRSNLNLVLIGSLLLEFSPAIWSPVVCSIFHCGLC